MNQSRCSAEKDERIEKKSHLFSCPKVRTWPVAPIERQTQSSPLLALTDYSYSGLRVHHTTAFCHFTTHAALSSEGGFHFSASKVHSGMFVNAIKLLIQSNCPMTIGF